ncbi:GRIP1-associated protein 1 [Labeo rohita]|uniref:GRIP1-associated protein 1 n=1 Tax=Labeo rohita TaxID=84645 RepID=A0ABQ8MGX3_LABRO|nr:GRIP1-associated protein 1 [Labeo rohita]
MAQALSEEEFHRMQAQLLELRTQNYQLSDELRKNTAELNSVRQKTSNLEKDYVKAQKALNKSKKAQEVDALLSENKMLQGKLHSQEDDFRLQNSTLMQELSKLCSQIEQLELENRRLREGQGLEGPISNPTSGPENAEVLRLQAENSALQKKLKALIDGLAGTNGVQSDASGHSDELSALGNDQVDQAEVQSVKPEQRDNELCAVVCINVCKRWVSEVALKLQMEMEEKCLLREQLQTLEMSKQAEITKLQEENAKRLQVEKEALYNDSRTKIDEIQQRKEEELKSINLRVQKLQTDLMTANQNVAELKEQLQSKQKEHELAIHALKDQVACQSAVSQEQVEGMLSENDALRTNLAALEQIQTVKTQELNLLREQNLALNAELQQRRTEQESFMAQRDDLNSQLQESNRANSRLLEQLTELGLEKDKLQQELEEARKVTTHKPSFYLLVFSVNSLQQPYVEELKAQVQSMEGTKGWFERRLKEAEETMEKNKLDHAEEIQRLQKDHSLQLESKAAEVEAVRQQVTEMQKEREELNNTISKLKQEIKDTVDGQRILEKKGSSALKDLKRQLHLERKRADKLQERLQEILTNTKTRTGLEELVLSEISSPSRTQQTGDSSSISSFSYREIMKDGASAPSTSKSNTSSPQSQRPADLSDDEVSELFQRLAEVQQEKWMLEEKVLYDVLTYHYSLMLLGEVELSWNSPGLQYCTKPSPGQFCCVLHRGLSKYFYSSTAMFITLLCDCGVWQFIADRIFVKHLEVSCASMADDICKKSAIIETYVMDSRRGKRLSLSLFVIVHGLRRACFLKAHDVKLNVTVLNAMARYEEASFHKYSLGVYFSTQIPGFSTRSVEAEQRFVFLFLKQEETILIVCPIAPEPTEIMGANVNHNRIIFLPSTSKFGSLYELHHREWVLMGTVLFEVARTNIIDIRTDPLKEDVTSVTGNNT